MKQGPKDITESVSIQTEVGLWHGMGYQPSLRLVAPAIDFCTWICYKSSQPSPLSVIAIVSIHFHFYQQELPFTVEPRFYQAIKLGPRLVHKIGDSYYES